MDNRHLVAEAGPPLDVADVYLEKQWQAPVSCIKYTSL